MQNILHYIATLLSYAFPIIMFLYAVCFIIDITCGKKVYTQGEVVLLREDTKKYYPGIFVAVENNVIFVRLNKKKSFLMKKGDRINLVCRKEMFGGGFLHYRLA